MLNMTQRGRCGKAKNSLLERFSKLRIPSESVTYNTNRHTPTESYSALLCRHCWEIQPLLWSCTAENPVFFKGSFAKWNTRQEPQQVDSRSAQETAPGSGVKRQRLEVQHKAFQEHNLPVQEKCKLRLSRTDWLPSSTLWHAVALVKGNSTQSLPDVKRAPISVGATNTKDFKDWPHWLEH